ncbi:fungal-specific transcription factor domain-containing protein [Infundibulicybe gibba]|nr:fungal-specific transcription factor domain-containing protein [Infundibulicybe gibba]
MLVKDALDVKGHFGVGGNTFGAQREEFWVHNSWQIHPPASPPIQIFPPPDLLSDLISLFFTHAQPCTLILHRPTFERLVGAGLHFKDHRFGNLVLAVCAVGSISSDDPRVLFPGSSSKHSRGWQWLKQINFYQNIFNGPMFGLHDIQAICLFLTFFFGSSNQDTSWVLLGLAIRSAQDIGVHRYKFRSRKPTVEEESWKRAFWILFCIDLGFSRTLGRPIATTFEDFDLDMPIECDDEYWENPDPELCFKQPAGKPSYITGLVKYIQLMEILAYVLRHLYCVRRSSLGPRVASQSDGRLVADLDSALNRWIDTVPGHLRWNPQMEDELWFAQSVMLYANYYHLQILVHRPFIPPPGQTSPLAFPSLAICANAARSCSRVVRAHTKRSFFPLPHLLDAAFTSAVILLLNIWGGRSSGISLDPVKEMEDVNKCFAFLRSQENRFLNAGQLWYQTFN